MSAATVKASDFQQPRCGTQLSLSFVQTHAIESNLFFFTRKIPRITRPTARVIFKFFASFSFSLPNNTNDHFRLLQNTQTIALILQGLSEASNNINTYLDPPNLSHTQRRGEREREREKRYEIRLPFGYGSRTAYTDPLGLIS